MKKTISLFTIAMILSTTTAFGDTAIGYGTTGIDTGGVEGIDTGGGKGIDTGGGKGIDTGGGKGIDTGGGKGIDTGGSKGPGGKYSISSLLAYFANLTNSR